MKIKTYDVDVVNYNGIEGYRSKEIKDGMWCKHSEVAEIVKAKDKEIRKLKKELASFKSHL